MKTTLIVAALVTTLTAGAAFAQNTTVTIAPADQTKVMGWVKTQNKASIPAPAGFTLAVGATLPQTVTLYPFAADVAVPTVTAYNYVLIDGKTVLVEPATRKIVQIW